MVRVCERAGTVGGQGAAGVSVCASKKGARGRGSLWVRGIRRAWLVVCVCVCDASKRAGGESGRGAALFVRRLRERVCCMWLVVC